MPLTQETSAAGLWSPRPAEIPPYSNGLPGRLDPPVLVPPPEPPVELLPPHASLPSYRPPLLFEVAWEVCNQIGGIYQVLRSKVPAMGKAWGDRYCLVGPDNGDTAQVEFEEQAPDAAMRAVLARLEAEGIPARYGRWLVTGRPKVILIDPRLPRDRIDALKYALWADHRLASPWHDPLADGVVAFAHGVRELFRALAEFYPSRPIVGHFHEWMGGLAIPQIRRLDLPVGLVFTTHATLLGRYLAPNRDQLYAELPGIDPAAEADRFRIREPHEMERACAHGAHVFTTVSSVTAEECRYLLGRQPDLILPNGLNIQRFDAKHWLQSMHAEGKEQINRFVRSHFFPHYSFDLDRTLYFFTAGRYEPHNKGFDLCLEAMARLNAEIKAAGMPITVVFFVVTQRPGVSISSACLRSRGVASELYDTCAAITRQVGARFFDHVTTGHMPQMSDLVDEYWMMRLRRTLHAWRRPGLPPVTTHDIEGAEHDPILAQIRGLWLDNSPEQPVKVIYHPEFISPANPLWKMDYEQFVRGCHLGVFPSAYEPWGYTPLECIAHGIPAVSSDLAGFGRWVQGHFADHDRWGAYVLQRRGRAFHESAADLTELLLGYCRLDRRARIAQRNAANDHAEHFDWGQLSAAYGQAHQRAMAAVIPAAELALA